MSCGMSTVVAIPAVKGGWGKRALGRGKGGGGEGELPGEFKPGGESRGELKKKKERPYASVRAAL